MALTWVKYSDGMPLSGAVIGGYDQGNPLYVARALHEGCIVPGKFHAVYKTTYISWAGKELERRRALTCCWAPPWIGSQLRMVQFQMGQSREVEDQMGVPYTLLEPR